MRLPAALAALALVLAGAGQAAPSEGAAALIASARADLTRGDGIAAEVRLKQAMEAGASRTDVAALMGEAFLFQDQRRRAREWLEAGDFSEQDAVTGFRSLARLERAEGHLREAGHAYDRALALAPDDAVLWVDVGRLRYIGSEHLLALEAVERAVASDPENLRALEFKGQVVRDQFGLVPSLAWFERGLTLAPNDIGLLGEYAATLGELGRAKDMLVVTRQMLSIDPGNARAFYLQAVLAARAGNVGLARGLMNRVGDRLADVPAAQLLTGVLELRAGNPDVALEVIEPLARRHPANLRLQDVLARALFDAGEERYIVDRFAALASRQDASPYLLMLMGRSWENLGRRDLAAGYLDRANFAQQPFVSPVTDGSPLGAMLAAGDLAGAAMQAEQARADFPGSADAQMRAGDVQLALGNGAAAYDRYRQAASVYFPTGLLLRMVDALSRAGRGQEAVGLAEAWLAHNPSSIEAARLVAGLSAQAGDWSRASALLDFARKSGKGRDTRLLADLALTQLRSGDKAGALISAERASSLQPASPFVAQAWGLSLAAEGSNPRRAERLLAKARRLLGDTPLNAEGRALLGAKR